MNSKLFTLSWLDIKNAIGVGFATALLVVILQIIEAGNIWVLDWKSLLNTGVIAFVGSIGSLLKDLLTTQKGYLAGVMKVK